MARPRHPMPPDVQAQLVERCVLADYEARPAYQRNDYLGWIAQAKRADTRQRRVAQMIEELDRGGVYMNMEHPPSRKH